MQQRLVTRLGHVRYQVPLLLDLLRSRIQSAKRCASWLNLVEVWFSILTRKSVRRGSFDTVRALVTHIGRYIERWNDHPHPFVWTKRPADLIKKVVRRAR